jgi:hypothetical protein
VIPWNADASGRDTVTGAWPAPIMVIAVDVEPEDVVRAAERVGVWGRCVRMLRREAQAWTHSEDCRDNPHSSPWSAADESRMAV